MAHNQLKNNCFIFIAVAMLITNDLLATLSNDSSIDRMEIRFPSLYTTIAIICKIACGNAV